MKHWERNHISYLWHGVTDVPCVMVSALCERDSMAQTMGKTVLLQHEYEVPSLANLEVLFFLHDNVDTTIIEELTIQ